MDLDWSLARVQQANAYQLADHLLIHIAGEKPDPCHCVDIERSLLTIEPPEFIARWRPRPEVVCADVVTPYDYQETFRVGGRREIVKLHHADGVLELAVQDLPQPPGKEGPAALAELAPSDVLNEATGYSKAFDFAEAFRDAISKLPDQGAGVPDWLYTYEVISIGAEIGGIAGFNHMYVRVRG